MMTTLGKVFACINVFLCLALAIWALGIYTHRVEWGDKRGENPGELAKRKMELERLSKSRPEGERAWHANLQTLRATEQRRRSNQAEYENTLHAMRTGMNLANQPANPPVGELVYVDKGNDRGMLKVNPLTELPEMQPARDVAGQPLPALVALERAYADTQQLLSAEKQTLEKLVAREKDLTVQINGGGAQKGLKAQLQERQKALLNSEGIRGYLDRLQKVGVLPHLPDPRGDLRNADGEQEYLRPLLYNKLAEKDILLQRQKALKARLQELEAVGAASPDR